MKKLILLSLSMVLISCEMAKPAAQGQKDQKKIDSLAVEIDSLTVKLAEVKNVLSRTLESGNSSFDQVKKEVENDSLIIAERAEFKNALSELAEVKSVLSYVLERSNNSFDQVKKQIENANKVWDLEIDKSPSIGSKDAKIVIVEFTEFQCPYCSQIAPYLDSLTRSNPKKIRLVYKNFPLSFHTDAPAAAAAAIAAGKQGKFWEYRWALAPNFRNLNDSTFIAVAEQVGLNITRFKKEMALDKEKQDIINRDMDLGIKVGVQGTPNFYVNGKRQDRFSKDLIEQLLKELY
ncbi:MAG: thioredoxin domain-containing protein [Candidatus Fibromonas sp.]|nr:thioredoxin domain-containing protein [Candidatus Fibromonas sp.]